MKKRLFALLALSLCVVLSLPALAFGVDRTPQDANIGRMFMNNTYCRAISDCINSGCGVIGDCIANCRAANVDPSASPNNAGNIGNGSQNGWGNAEARGGNVQCPGFTDSNNDGICDNFGTYNCSHSNGCNGFIDSDNDGVCDNYSVYGCAHARSCYDGLAQGRPGSNSGYGHHGNGHGYHHRTN